MILTEKVFVKIIGKTINKYRKIGYDCNVNQIIEVYVKDLTNGSHILVEVKCDICGKIKNLPYKEYIRSIKNGGYYSCSFKCSEDKYIKTCEERYGVENPSFIKEVIDKRKNTCLEKYGVEFPIQSNEIKSKIHKTNLERYGNIYPNKTYEVKNKSRKTMMEKNNIPFYPKNFYKKKFDVYLLKIINLTKKNKKKLLEKWDGYDYYDNEYIKDNFLLNPNCKNYPTVDHKVSIFYGYHNNIEADEIANINNLCITKRSINSKKQTLTEYEFNLIKPF